jgi:hypothetical protein
LTNGNNEQVSDVGASSSTVTLALAQFLPVNANFHPFPTVPAPAGVQITFDKQSPVENSIYSNGTIDAIFNVTADGPSFINGQPVANKYPSMETQL